MKPPRAQPRRDASPEARPGRAEDLRSRFLFATCQVGSEPFLKEELRIAHPELRFAFSRPGFVTFKHADGEMGLRFELRSAFARVWGLSFGRIETAEGEDSAVAAARRLTQIGGPLDSLRVHVFARDRHAPGREPRDYDPEAATAQARAALASHLEPSKWSINEPARPGQVVLACVVIEPDEWWIGAFRCGSRSPPTPGGYPPLRLPDEAPSRVWAKIEEALWLSRLPLQAGDRVLDIGSAPGGGASALLQRGLRVTGVDPADMDAIVAEHPAFTHLRMSFEQLEHTPLPDDIRWLIFDVNLAPRLTLGRLVRIALRLDSLQGAIVTLKLAGLPSMKHLPWMRGRLHALGMRDPLVTQLVSNRQELTAVGTIERVGQPARAQEKPRKPRSR